MIKASVAYVLCRIEDDASLSPVSEHQDIVAAVGAGKHQVELEDFDFSYALYADGVKVASFAEGRIGYREWARRSGRLECIHSIDDRYDHDIDELMALHISSSGRSLTEGAPVLSLSTGGWVARKEWAMTGSAHSAEKSASILVRASIYRLSSS